MTAPITTRFIANAIRLIDKTIPDPNAEWVSVSDAAATPDEPWVVGGRVSVKTPIRILFDRDTREDRQLDRYEDGSTRRTGQTNAYMYPIAGLEPKLQDTVIWNGTEYTVVNIDPIQPIDDVILYTMELIK